MTYLIFVRILNDALIRFDASFVFSSQVGVSAWSKVCGLYSKESGGYVKPLMTLKELQSVTSAYDGFATILDCNIPAYYKEVFPKYCRCGAEMIMTEPGHTRLQCCNPCCWIKMAHRLAYFISYHGFKGFGTQACLSLFTACHDILPYYSFLSVFMLNDTQLASGLTDYQLGLFNEVKQELKNTAFHFSDAIASLGIPNIGSRSALFDIVKSPVVLVKYVLDAKTNDLCDMAGIQAESTRFYLRSFDIDIVLLMRDVMPHIMNTPRGEVFVAITGRVSVKGNAYSRSEFIALCESIKDANGTQLYKIVETKAQDKLQYVIADTPSNSDKYRLGERLGKLITADTFYDTLVSAVEADKKETDAKSREEQSNGQ